MVSGLGPGWGGEVADSVENCRRLYCLGFEHEEMEDILVYSDSEGPPSLAPGEDSEQYPIPESSTGGGGE